MSDLVSRPYKPDAARCCEACVFGRGEHAAWCEREPVRRFIENGRVAQEEIDKLLEEARCK